MFDRARELFEEALKEGKDILHLCLSSGISGSINSALIAKDLLAEKYPGDISQNALANKIKTSSGTVNTILDLLEKTQLIFHTEPYSGANTRAKKS